MSKICSKCGSQIKDGAAFCPNCGTAAPADIPPSGGNFCASCGSPVFSGAAFCNKCGAKVKTAAQAQTAQQSFQPVQPAIPQQSVQPAAQQQPVYQQPMYPQPQQMYSQPGQLMTQQLAQQAYMNAQYYQNMAAMNMKPKRYIPLRVILVIICLILGFFLWKDGFRNIQNASLEPTAFSGSLSEEEDKDAIQAAYDEAYAAPPEMPAFTPSHDIYSWLYGDTVEEGGEQQ